MIRRLLSTPPPAAVVFASAVMLVLVGIADERVAREIGMDVFYLLPVALAAWFLDRTWGMGFALSAAGLWLILEVMDQPPLWDAVVVLWNGLARVVVFAGVALALSALRDALRRGDALTRVDDLTGARNATAYYEAARIELDRARRAGAVTTVAFFDVAGLEDVIASKGRGAADRLLRTVASSIQGVIRSTDLLARLHDDEFAVLFPDTDRIEAGAVLLKVSESVLAAMRRNTWDATLRMGAVTFAEPPESVNDMRRVAEDVLHTARERGTNVIEHQVVG